MIVDPGTRSPGALYRFLIGLVIPRPIAFVSTVGASGSFNVAPFSYFNLVSSDPPLLSVAINHRKGEPKDTLRNIRAGGDFVVNLVDEALLTRAVHASGDWPQDVDEFALTGLTAVASDRVRAPRVGESPASFECTLFREVDLGATSLVLGRIERIHVRDEVLEGEAVDPVKLKLVGRLGGDGYSVVREVIHAARPKVV